MCYNLVVLQMLTLIGRVLDLSNSEGRNSWKMGNGMTAGLLGL